MEKINKFILMGTVALSGMAGLASCASENEDGGKTSPVENGVVKTQFALNIPYSKTQTRQTADIVQNSGNFRGLQEMHLFTLAGDPEKESTVTATTGEETLTLDGALEKEKEKRYIYKDVAIKTGTKHFLLYTKATRETGASNESVGKLTTSFGTGTAGAYQLESISTSLSTIAANKTLATEGSEVLTAINNVLDASGKIGNGDETKTWKAVAKEANPSTTAEQHAKQLFIQFTAMKAGSANSVKALLQTLESQAKGEAGTLLADIAAKCAAGITQLDSKTFPATIGLPDGAIGIEYNSTDEVFKFKDSSNSLFTGNLIKYKEITYPAELDYFVSTPAMVSDNLATGLDGWPTYENWKQSNWEGKGFKEGEVTANTRSIGLKNPIQYAVANLAFTIDANSDNVTDKAENGNTNTISVKNTSDGYNFAVTGILVGGQPKAVNWKYEPSSDAEADFCYTVYDKTMNTGNIYLKQKDETATTNYTLLLDNNKSGEQIRSVNVAVELQNNSGKDFNGADGIVPAGGKFYLIGKLNLTSGGVVDHIFVKDYTTTAKFHVSSLASAYNTIPDLRQSALSLGLAVDLTWEAGMEFDVNFD